MLEATFQFWSKICVVHYLHFGSILENSFFNKTMLLCIQLRLLKNGLESNHFVF